MIDNVLEFKRPKSKIQDRLDERLDKLEDLYDSLERAFSIVSTIEEKIDLEEEYYDGDLLDYAKEIGTENIELKYLNYSTNILVVDTEAGFSLLWENPDEQEEDETPQ